MKKIIFICMAFVFSSSVVMAQDKTGLYVGILGGTVFPADLEVTDKSPTDPVTVADQDLDNGYVFGAKVGCLLPNKMFGLELEYNYVDATDAGTQYAYTYLGFPVNLEGKISMNNLFLNLILRHPHGKFHPYIGIGPGWAWVDYDDMKLSLNIGGLNISTVPQSESDNTFAFQVLAGVEADISPEASFVLGYKYLQCEPELSKFQVDTRYRAHMITAGLNYYF